MFLDKIDKRLGVGGSSDGEDEGTRAKPMSQSTFVSVHSRPVNVRFGSIQMVHVQFGRTPSL